MGAIDSGLDRWLQRGAVAVMVAVALVLLTLGIVLYARPVHAAPVSDAGQVDVEAPLRAAK